MNSTLPQGCAGTQRSPARSPEGSDGAGSERREHVRRMLRVPAHLDAPGAHNPIQLIDICRAGVAFASKPALPLGSEFRVSFELPTAPGTINTVSGVVVYCKLLPASQLHKVGARLQAIDEAIALRIVDFVTASFIP